MALFQTRFASSSGIARLDEGDRACEGPAGDARYPASRCTSDIGRAERVFSPSTIIASWHRADARQRAQSIQHRRDSGLERFLCGTRAVLPMRPPLTLLAVSLCVVARSLTAAAAGVRTLPPLSAFGVCTTFLAQAVMTALGEHRLPQTAYTRSATMTATGYATCFYDFSSTKYVSIGLYGPAKVYPTKVRTRVPQLGVTARVAISRPEVIV